LEILGENKRYFGNAWKKAWRNLEAPHVAARANGLRPLPIGIAGKRLRGAPEAFPSIPQERYALAQFCALTRGELGEIAGILDMRIVDESYRPGRTAGAQKQHR